MWCPLCGDEYRPGFTICAECGTVLVEDEPVVASGLLPEHRHAEPIFTARRYAHSAELMYEAVVESFRRLPVDSATSDPARLTVVGSNKKGGLFDGWADVAVEVTSAGDGSSIVKCTAQAQAMIPMLNAVPSEEQWIRWFFARLDKTVRSAGQSPKGRRRRRTPKL
jgi:hypothetical protein